MRALLVEDSETLRSSISTALTATGYSVQAEGDGLSGLEAARSGSFDVIILDLMLPGMGGLDMIKTLRAEGHDVPILCLTARDTVDDKVEGLRAGADDYLVKPFELRELLARVFVQCRRRQPSDVAPDTTISTTPDTPVESGEVLSCAGVELDTGTGRASRDGVAINLHAREFTLLAYFLSRPERILNLDQIEAHLYPDAPPRSNAVAAAICTLRRELKTHPGAAPLIHTRRGLGYVFSAPIG